MWSLGGTSVNTGRAPSTGTAAAPPSGTKNCSWPLPVAMETCLFST